MEKKELDKAFKIQAHKTVKVDYGKGRFVDEPVLTRPRFEAAVKMLDLEKTCRLSDSTIEYPPHKEDVLLCIQDMDLPNSEKYVVGGYYDKDINEYCPYVDDPDQYDVLMWLPLPRAAKYWLK